MKSRPSVIGSTFSAGIAAGVLWWIANRCYTVNGVGWLERQAWPLNNVWLIATLGALVGLIAGLVRRAHGRRHDASIEDLCQRWGFTFAATASGDALPLAVWPAWQDARCHMSGTRNGLPIEIVDVTVTEGTGDAARSRDWTVILLEAEGLPDFELHPRTFTARLLELAGVPLVPFDVAAVRDPVAAADVREFTRHWLLVAADQDAARRLFRPEVMRDLERFVGWSLQSRGGYLALWFGDGVQPAATREQLLHQALEMHDLLTRAAGRPDDQDLVPPLPAEQTKQRAARLGCTVVGGVAGLFAGFFGGFALFVTYVFGRDVAGERFAVTAVLFFASIFGGAAIGAVVGAVLSTLVARSVRLPTARQNRDGSER